MKLVRYAADGRKLKPDWDLPDDGKTNPYVDMAVAPDGRVLDVYKRQSSACWPTSPCSTSRTSPPGCT